MSICLREKQLSELFQQFGKVLHIEVRKSKEEFKFQGYGFATMSLREEAQNAMNGLNGLMIDRLVYEETIRELFSHFDCEVMDVKFKQYKIDVERKSQHGLGFVHYPLTVSGVLAVKRALHRLGCVCVEEVFCVDAGMSVTLERILRDRPELDVKYIPEGHTCEPVYSSTSLRLKTADTYTRLSLAAPLPTVPLSWLEHFIAPPDVPVAKQAQVAPSPGPYGAYPPPVLFQQPN
eukprot:gene34481-42526_t